jgi:hypothetical protein
MYTIFKIRATDVYLEKVKTTEVKVIPCGCTTLWRCIEEVEVRLYIFLTTQHSRSGSFNFNERNPLD